VTGVRDTIARAAAAMRPLLASLLLVGSIVPIALVALPMAQDEHERFADRYLNRDPLPAPDVPAPQPGGALPAYGSTAGVPVLAYHGIDAKGRYSVSQDEFARQMATLDSMGVEAISVDQFAAHVNGDDTELPPRPVLITFDDGLLSSYRGADAVLEQHGFRAVMYAIAGSTEAGSEYYLSAGELSEMVASERWDVQLHAGEGHISVPVDAAGNEGSYYANRQFAQGRLESFADYRDRITTDLSEGQERLTAEVEGFGGQTFSFPYGDYGQHETNDPRIPRFLTRWLGERFEALFHQPSDPSFTKAGARPPVYERFELRAGTSAADLAAWLRHGALAGDTSAGARAR
jgi:peptidoglycan/xylan/chitin deacetylase (PgdA/CDA1 family)